MPNIMALAGCGTSLGNVIYDPSMADNIIRKINYDVSKLGNQNIEEFLSYCEAYQQINNDLELNEFLIESKKIILKECKFNKTPSALFAHREFIKKLARRKAKDNRIKLFTTNYDTCFEDLYM